MEETPEKLDWVMRRADCEPDEAFQKLREAVESDVATFNSRFNLEPSQAVVFQKRDDYGLFSAYRRVSAGFLTVEFRGKFDRIEIADEAGAQTLSATPFLAENGRCKFQVGGEEIEQWQLRRKALDALFFKPLSR